MANWLLDSVTDSGNNPIEFHPSPGYREEEVGQRRHHNMLGGNQQTTYWPTRKRWMVPTTWVNSADAFRVQTWWENGNQLLWTLSDSGAPSTFSVLIANQERPFQQYHQVNRDQFQGVMILETVDDSAAIVRGTFILDDDVFGLLDTDGNVLG